MISTKIFSRCSSTSLLFRLGLVSKSVKWLHCSSLSISRVATCRTVFPQSAVRSVSIFTPCHSSNVEIINQGKNLSIKIDGENISCHHTWLRHNCQCPLCLNCEQKTIDMSEIKPTITVESAYITSK